jgi:hypothetical protein
MTLRYDDDLIEAAVFLCASGRRNGIPSLQVARFNRQREKLYDLLDPDERNAAFFKLHLDWFREWGLEQALTDLVAGFPRLSEALAVLAFRKARGKNEEGAELFVNQESRPGVLSGPGRLGACPTLVRTGVVALLPERFTQDDTLARLLRHELTHLQDMVDPAFGYAPELRVPGHNQAQQRLARERYRLLWDITIDGRLARAGHAAAGACERHEAAFHRAYSFWPDAKRRQVFEELWTEPAPRHEHLEALATDPRDLAHAHQPLPGAPCPLCGFPTFAWADTATLSPPILDAIQADFAHWTTAQGACARCAETYQASRKFAFPPTVFV